MEADPNTTGAGTSVWPLYLAAGGLGLAFLVTLLVLAWDNAVEREIQGFGFESLSVDDTVRTNIQAANDAIGNIARIMGVFPALSEQQLARLSEPVIAQYPFITAVGVYENPGTGVYVRKLAYETASSEQLPSNVDLNGAGGFSAAFAAAETAGAAFPSERLLSGNAAGHFALAQSSVETDSGNARQTPPAITVALISPTVLLDNIAASAQLAVTLYSESEGIGGRQLLFERTPSQLGERWNIDTLEQSTQVRFDRYSIRLIAKKNLYWEDLGKALLFTALVLGIGVTLLLIALARAKELQARELLARNRVIEEQVTRQTFELAEARDQALEASRVKSDFLASMSHEIRTPLNAIIGMAELLSDTELSGDQVKFVGVFKNAGEALLSLVNDILDLSKIEAGQLTLEHIDFDVRELLEQSAEIYALKTDAKGIELTSHIAANVPERIKGDPSRLRQIILNLIGNAIKFTEHGEISVRVVALDESNPLRLLFSVSDTGIGIPKDKLESIFGSFTQVDSSTTRKYGGTGLGLTISQKLVEKMRGRIWVESVEGAGSTFKFEIETEPAAAKESSHDQIPDLSGKHVLVIDDNDTNRLILKESMELCGAQVSDAANGEAALRFFVGGPQSIQFELILCDVQMPGMDGFEVANKIVESGAASNTLMMLSSANLGQDMERAQKMALGGYLVKPIKRADLYTSIVQLRKIDEEKSSRGGSSSEQADVAAVSDTKRILLVEDNPDNRMLIKAYLKKQPYDIEEAEDGKKAVALFSSNQYDIVLMDVQMPVMDGHTATRKIREIETAEGRTPVTPVVALTAHAIKEEQEKSLAAGCTAHLTKPIKKQTLIQALEEIMG